MRLTSQLLLSAAFAVAWAASVIYAEHAGMREQAARDHPPLFHTCDGKPPILKTGEVRRFTVDADGMLFEDDCDGDGNWQHIIWTDQPIPEPPQWYRFGKPADNDKFVVVPEKGLFSKQWRIEDGGEKNGCIDGAGKDCLLGEKP